MTAYLDLLSSGWLAHGADLLWLRTAGRRARATGTRALARDGEGQAHQDSRRPCALLLSGGARYRGLKVEQVVPPVKGIPEHFIAGNAIEKRLADMDAMAIDMEILSINPFWYRAERDKAEAICRSNNEKLAELCARTRTVSAPSRRSRCNFPISR